MLYFGINECLYAVCVCVAGCVARSHASLLLLCLILLCFFSCQEPSRYKYIRKQNYKEHACVCVSSSDTNNLYTRSCHHQPHIARIPHRLLAWVYARHCHTTEFIFDMFSRISYTTDTKELVNSRSPIITTGE